jgi:putative RNA 2'-phosphotransferase
MKNKSKFLSLLLRHKPKEYGISLDSFGWCDVQELLSVVKLSMLELLFIVENNDKKRFEMSDDGKYIRACQGHSICVDLCLEEVIPDYKLYHGTSEDRLLSILETGINKGNRHHVHLSTDYKTSNIVGMRKGSPIILEIDVKGMTDAGYKFYVSKNGVYLTEFIPAVFIKIKNKSK